MSASKPERGGSELRDPFFVGKPGGNHCRPAMMFPSFSESVNENLADSEKEVLCEILSVSRRGFGVGFSESR